MDDLTRPRSHTGRMCARDQPRPAPKRRVSIGLETRDRLEEWIARVVSASCGKVIVHVEHSLNAYASRNGSGIATCTFGTGVSASVFWKIGAAKSVESPKRLGCVGNELHAYGEIARVEGALAPKLIGGDICDTDALLVTEYLGSIFRVQRVHTPEHWRAPQVESVPSTRAL